MTNDTNNGNGFYVMGQYQSVAWHKQRKQAQRLADLMNMRGGCVYRVEPVKRQCGLDCAYHAGGDCTCGAFYPPGFVPGEDF
jgi:hypothetical protein